MSGLASFVWINIVLFDRATGAIDEVRLRTFGYGSLRKYSLALELYAEDYEAAGGTEKTVQISMVLLKHTKEIYLSQGPEAAGPNSAEQDAALEAEAAPLSDEELERAVKEG